VEPYRAGMMAIIVFRFDWLIYFEFLGVTKNFEL